MNSRRPGGADAGRLTARSYLVRGYLSFVNEIRDGMRVRVVRRTVSAEDRKENRYFEHLIGLTGTVQQVYSPTEVAVKVDETALQGVAEELHRESVRRMREKFVSSIGEEQRSKLTPEELEFRADFVILVRAEDLEPYDGPVEGNETGG